MNRSLARVIVAVALMALMPGVASAASAAPSVTAVAPVTTSAEAAARVEALDPRFADLPDYTTLQRQTSSDFDFVHVLASSYVRVLPTFGAMLEFLGTDQATTDPAYGWLVEVTLVAECPSSVRAPVDADPCGWRHTWMHRVTTDGQVTVIYEEGAPDVGHE